MCRYGVSESVQGNWFKSLIEEPSDWLIISWKNLHIHALVCHLEKQGHTEREPSLSNIPLRAWLFTGYFWRPGANHSWDFACLKEFQMWTLIIVQQSTNGGGWQSSYIFNKLNPQSPKPFWIYCRDFSVLSSGFIGAVQKHHVDNLEKLVPISPRKLRHGGHLHNKLSI